MTRAGFDICTCEHPADDHQLEGGDTPVILQAAPCHDNGCDCDDWDATEQFPGRPPIYSAIVGLDEDGNVTVTEGTAAMTDEQTDQDLIVGHPFTPATTFADAWPGICGWDVDGLPCGYSRAEHADQGRQP